MAASRNKSELELREQVELSKQIAFEKCRLFRDHSSLTHTNHDSFVWSKKECHEASRKVVEQAEELRELLNVKYGSKSNQP